MEYDIFFSISQTPDHTGYTPSESKMFDNYYSQLDAADRLACSSPFIHSHTTTEFETGCTTLER